MTDRAEIIRQIARIQLQLLEAKELADSLQDERNALAALLDFEDATTIKGCGISITKTENVSITEAAEEVDEELYTRYTAAKRDTEDAKKALIKRCRASDNLGLKVTASFRITGSPEVSE